MPQLIEIPLSEGAPLPFFDVQAVLDGVTYTLQIRWNVRASSWYMDVLDEAGGTVVAGGAGHRLVANWPLGAYRTGRQPPGAFLCEDTSGQDLDPALADLGTRCRLLYFTASELGVG